MFSLWIALIIFISVVLRICWVGVVSALVSDAYVSQHWPYGGLLNTCLGFGGPLAIEGATPPGPPFDSMPVSWMKSAYYNRVDICLCTNTKILSLVQ